MIDNNLNGEQFINLIKILFTVSLSMALLIILIFHYYRNKYLTLTKYK
jgi:hypothetical protein